MNETWWVNASQLDEDQKEVLRASPDDSLLITGPPGSGKTNILVLRANYVRYKYPRILFITFTRTLAEFIKSGPTIGRADQIKHEEIVTFMAWGKRLLKDAGVTVSLGNGSFRSQRKNLVNALAEYIDDCRPGQLYDVVFVDEVQDFLAAELTVLSRLAHRINGAGDSRQTIWSHREGLPTMEALSSKKVELTWHYRIGPKICKFADRILPPKLGDADMIEGCKYDDVKLPSSVEPIPSVNAIAEYQTCIENIRNQLRYIVDEPILVIAHTTACRDDFWEALSLYNDLAGNAVLQSSEGYEAFTSDAMIRVMTIASAKGSEARAVHILQAHKLDASLRELAFTGVTRAKTEVLLYHTEPLPGHLIPPAESLPELDALF